MLYEIKFSGPKDAFPEKMIDRMIELDKHGDIPPYVSKKSRIRGGIKQMTYLYPNELSSDKAMIAFMHLAKLLNRDHTRITSVNGERENHPTRYYVFRDGQ